jgi:putative sterol carrier protein
MGEYFKDKEHMYECFGALFEKLRFSEKLGAKVAKSGMIIRFVWTDPDGCIVINFKDKPEEEGAFGAYTFDDMDSPVDVTTTQTADFSHRFWQGLENPIMALPKGKIKAQGAIGKLMGLVGVVRPAFRMYPKVLEELGYTELVLKKR